MNNYNNEYKTYSLFNKSNLHGYKATKNNTPVLFNKKIKKLVIKPLKHIYSDSGKTRHFTPAAQEWFNSIYSFNKNYTKTLPTADKNLMELLKSYFNFQFKLKAYKIKRIPTRYKRLSANKIFVGRGDLKHTNNKVIITFYVYNTESFFLFRNIKYLLKSLYEPIPLEMSIKTGRYDNRIITYNRPFSMDEYLSLRSHYTEWYFTYILHFVHKLNGYYSSINSWYEILTKLIENNILNKNEQKFLFNKYANLYTFNYPKYNFYIAKCKINYMKNLTKYRLLLNLNKTKFNTIFLEKLKGLVSSIYNKGIRFNIVNLKKLHLNSDIFTQAVSLKLRNRDNKMYRVLKSSLRKLKLQNVSRAKRLKKGNFSKNLINQIRNDSINSMFTKNNVKDRLNSLLLDYFPSCDDLRLKTIKYRMAKVKKVSLETYIFSNLKHRKMAGIKIEAKGRLTKRFTASRSVFKMKWKGGLKNVDSSFKGLSAIMLRGHVKSNLQYSLLNSKNRNGAFGVKGWVSNK
jgi:Mitochondrial ribosomal protein (VAR1)